MLLLARTTPLDRREEEVGRTVGVSRRARRTPEQRGMRVRPIRNMVNHETNEVFFDNFEIPAENLIGEEGKGFRYILDGMNAERILIAAECIGDGYWFIDRARKYASERVVFDRPIGQNQGVQFPIARAYANVRAADLMRYEAARLFEAGEPCGAEANMAKLLAADASWEAANVCLQTYGGFGFAAEYDVERKFRETRLYQVAPISTNMILSYIGRARARPAEVVSDAARPGLRVVALEQAVAGAVLLAAARRHGRRRHQDRASRRRRFGARVRQRAQRHVGVLRVAESRQAERGARSEGDADRDACARLIDARGRLRAQPRARRDGATRASATTRCRRATRASIWCGISGYGPDGPMRDKKAYDMLVQAESGVVSVTGSDDGAGEGRRLDRRHRVGDVRLFVDPRRARMRASGPGVGERIDISMLECLTEWMTPALYVWQGAGRVVAARRRSPQHDRAVRRVRVRRRRRDVRDSDGS